MMDEKQQARWDEACSIEKDNPNNPRVLLEVIQIRQEILQEVWNKQKA